MTRCTDLFEHKSSPLSKCFDKVSQEHPPPYFTLYSFTPISPPFPTVFFCHFQSELHLTSPMLKKYNQPIRGQESRCIVLPAVHSHFLHSPSVCSDEGLTLETSAKHHIPQATNIPYQPLLIKPIFSALAHAEKQFLFKTSLPVHGHFRSITQI